MFFLADPACLQLPRCIGNLLFCLNTKALRKCFEKKTKPPKAAIDNLQHALGAIKENNLEIPAGLQALTTHFTQPQSQDEK